MKKTIIMAAAVAMLCGCAKKSDNPLFNEFTAPYGIAPFSEITIEHYREGMLKGMEEQKAEIEAIVNNTEEPTFENTIAAMDRSGELMRKVRGTFSPLSSSNSTDEMRALEKELSPMFSSHSDDIYMNAELFARVKAVYEQREGLGLNAEQQKVLENIYDRFVNSGAELSDEQKAKLRELNKELSMLQLTFSQNLLHETNNTFVTVDNIEELAGLPEANIAAAAKMAEQNGQAGKWMFNMQRPSCNPVLQYCENRELREKVYNAYYNRGNQDNDYDNKAISAKIVALRLEKARLMGFDNYAQLALDSRMAKTPEAVYALLDQVWTPAVKKAKEEIEDIRQEIRKEGKSFEPAGWDYMYYLDKAKKAKYAVDEQQVREYLEINNVMQGVFYVANKLYGLTFKEITSEVPSYEPTAKAYEVIDRDGTTLAIFYSDNFPRESKRAGAWCTSFRGQSYEGDERIIPIVINCCNMTAAADGAPALQSIDNVETIFHEFGHALHSFMRDVKYNGASGVERDFVELPSQINEHWAFHPEVLAVYAKHYKTGEIIPMELVKKIDESSKYGQGFATVEYLAASLSDMDLHVLTEIPENLNVMDFEAQKLAERGIPQQILPRYRMTNFSHTMGGGYTAGYYSYMWAEVLDADAFDAFAETGDIFNQEVAAAFRKYVLTPGGIDDGMTMYKAFRGREPKIDALLRNRGL
ncbi:MAG: M3 family metallopeptidase [Rikenellaceae bacterium]|nr:M3 family metallopeptidase [Rikenellaceae bacterium]MBQ3536747.1 M3 family metallopeptidase [Alistipes sp.]